MNYVKHRKKRKKQLAATLGCSKSDEMRTRKEVIKHIADNKINVDELVESHRSLTYAQTKAHFPSDPASDFKCVFTSSNYADNLPGKFTHVQWTTP